MKRCSSCKQLKPIDQFNRNSKRGHSGHCKLCNALSCREYDKQRKLNDPQFAERERIRAQQRRSTKKQRIKNVFRSIRQSASKRGVPFDLEEIYIRVLFDAQNWRCARTGLEFDLTPGHGIRPFGPTVDRIDSSGPYALGNIQIVCNIYNFAKNAFTDQDVLTFAEKLLEHRQSKH